MGRARRKKYNTLALGFTAGLLIPVAGFVFIYLCRYGDSPFQSYVTSLLEMKLLVKLLSLCGFANLLVFYFFYRNKMDQAARGVIIATFLYAFVVLLSGLF